MKRGQAELREIILSQDKSSESQISHRKFKEIIRILAKSYNSREIIVNQGETQQNSRKAIRLPEYKKSSLLQKNIEKKV